MRYIRYIIPTLMVLAIMLINVKDQYRSNSIINKRDMVNMEIEIIEKESFSKTWEQIDFPFTIDELYILKKIIPIVSNQEAKDIANMIINEYHLNGKVPEYMLVCIIHYKKDNVWMFEYAVDSKDVLGEYFYIAIDGEKGEIIKAWAGE